MRTNTHTHTHARTHTHTHTLTHACTHARTHTHTHTLTHTHTYTKTHTQMFKDVLQPDSQLRKRPIPPSLPAGSKGFVPVLVPGTNTGKLSPLGFSTMKTMKVGGGRDGGGGAVCECVCACVPLAGSCLRDACRLLAVGRRGWSCTKAFQVIILNK